jgi:hypothetical protein
VTVTQRGLLDEPFDFFVSIRNFLLARAFYVQVLASLPRARFPIKFEELSLGLDFAASHLKDALDEVLALCTIACLLWEVIDFEFHSENVVLFIFLVNKLVSD